MPLAPEQHALRCAARPRRRKPVAKPPRTLRQSATVVQEKAGMARACLSAYAKSAQPRACRSACTMRAHMVRAKPGACRLSMLIGAGIAASRACARAARPV